MLTVLFAFNKISLSLTPKNKQLSVVKVHYNYFFFFEDFPIEGDDSITKLTHTIRMLGFEIMTSPRRAIAPNHYISGSFANTIF